jgi:hypothetical protein
MKTQKSESPTAIGLNAKQISDTLILPPAQQTGKSPARNGGAA